MIFNEEIFELNSIRVKDSNKEKVYKLIYSEAPLSQKRIIELLGIRPMDLSAIIKELLADHLIETVTTAQNRKRGRPNVYFKASTGRFYTIGVYTVARFLKGALIDIHNNVFQEAKVALPEGSTNKDFSVLLSSLIESLLDKKSEQGKLLGIGISLIGNVDSTHNCWKESNKWPHIINFDFSYLKEYYNTDVEIIRDLDSVLFFEMLKDKGLQKGTTLLVRWGEGLGVAYANEGLIIKSRFGRFGNIGATTIGLIDNGEGINSTYSRNRTLDYYASVRNLRNELSETVSFFSDDEDEWGEVFKHIDFPHLPQFQAAIESMVVGLQNLSLLFFPDHILFIGPFAENKDLVKKISEKYRATSLPHGINKWTKISASNYGYRGCLFGGTYNITRNGLKSYLIARY